MTKFWTYGFFFQVCSLVIGCLNLCNCEGIHYFESIEKKSCDALVSINSSIVLTCKHSNYDLQSIINTQCILKSIEWIKDMKSISNSSSKKFSSSFPKRTNEHFHSTYMLPHVIEKARLEDIGEYRCAIECLDYKNHVVHFSKKIDLCMEEEASKTALCYSQLPSGHCAETFWDGICDLDCVDERNHFAGFECGANIPKCKPHLLEHCLKNYANGICDHECNEIECGLDGADCMSKPLKWIHGSLVLFLHETSAHPNVINLNDIELSLITLLRTFVSVNAIDDEKVKRTHMNNKTILIRKEKQIKIDIKVLKNFRQKNSFKKIKQVSEFLVLAIKNGWNPGFWIKKVSRIAIIRKMKNQCGKVTKSEEDIHKRIVFQKDYKSAEMTEISTIPSSSLSIIKVTCLVVGCSCLILMMLFIFIMINRIYKRSDYREFLNPNNYKYKLHSSDI